MPDHYIGLISGTSMDGIDAVIASFGQDAIVLHATHAHAYPRELRNLLKSTISNPDECGVDQLAMLDRLVGACFRDAALEVIKKSNIDKGDIAAIGSHGQTLRHQPTSEHPFSLQIGDPATVAVGTGITTVADFRRADIAAGGQGAPLVPPFHDWLFRSRSEHRAILNIGGIANITVLPIDNSPVLGFDTGPGNTLLDAWISEQRGLPYDSDGRWAADGKIIPSLLDELMADDYFNLMPPKSTGFEHFNLEWLRAFGVEERKPEDVQATLSELTARTIADAIDGHCPATQALYVCGGGVHNHDLLRRLGSCLSGAALASTLDAGLDPDWVEAAAFAWLAMRTMKKKSGNLPSVTGASRKLVLGAIHSP
ncbi:MAG: anhydro-N-acetylmuramic acid kinase [Gammaproteobacteria bacterium]|nr:anhydro-N-acetylmuramic acid kinase [Gammaproteobacteria bacterium]